MAKGPGVPVTSHIIATSQNNIHYYIEKIGVLQAYLRKTFKLIFSDEMTSFIAVLIFNIQAALPILLNT
ncbi:hypothetical protein [Paenibacillus amylolyticus]|uniref:Transposase n=1 Tax=Paenibacillus amylolyticus TaxID=1451 RepID=A0ABD8ARI1_PAEAM